MSDKSNEELVKLIKDNIDVKQNYEELYKQNSGYIYTVIRRYLDFNNNILEQDDFMQQAFIGLVNAVEVFDDTRGCKFISMLKWYIRNSIREYIGQQEIPEHMKSKILKYKKACKQLYEDLKRPPTNYEISLEMNIEEKHLKLIRQAMSNIISLDEEIGDGDGGTTRLNLLTDESIISAQEELEKNDLKRIIHERVEQLSESPRVIIQDRYFNNMTLEDISQERNVSRERVRKLEINALQTLRKDYKFRKKIIDYTSLNEYKKVGVNEFNRTWTSSTECLVLQREKLREEENRKLDEMLKNVKEHENIMNLGSS